MIRPVVVLLASTTLWLASSGLTTRQSVPTSVLTIENVTVIDGSDPSPRPGMTVVVEDGIITRVAPATRIANPEGQARLTLPASRPPLPQRAPLTGQAGQAAQAGQSGRVLDGRHKYLIPGLWDMHVHLVYGDEASLAVYVANGVTSVRDLGGDLRILNRWRARIAQGEILGPTIEAAAGPILESAEWIHRIETVIWPRIAARGIPPKGWGDIPHVPVASPADAEAAIAQTKAAGGDFAKIRTVASLETYLALVTAAKRAHLMVASHPPPDGALLQASNAGVTSIEHFACSDATENLTLDKRNELFAALATNHTWMDPTIVSGLVSGTSGPEISRVLADEAAEGGPRPHRLPETLAQSFRVDYQVSQLVETEESRAKQNQANARELDCEAAMHKAGVGFVAGTDVGALLVFPGFSLHDELELLVTKVGLSPAEALKAATLNAARLLSVDHTIGTVQVGRIANLVLLEANPLDDIRNTRQISTVILKGRVVPR